MRIRRVIAGACAGALVGALSGCAALGSVTSQACVSWVDFEDPQAMFDDATLVVAGVAEAADGSVDLISGPGERHLFIVDELFKGAIDVEELWVAAPRDYCVAEAPQPADDPIPTGERVLLFLTPASAEPIPVEEAPEIADVDAWSTLTPLDGVLAFPDGADPPPMAPEVG